MKTLLNNEADLHKWLSGLIDEIGTGNSVFGCIEELEGYFGIDFLDAQGRTFEQYEDEMQPGEWEYDWVMATPMAYNVRKRYDSVGLPETYPCLVVSFFDNSFDRVGDVTIRALEYVYPADMTA